MSTRKARRAAVAVLSLLASGCNVSNMAFTKNDSLHFTAPKSRALVALPVTLSWSIDGFQLEKQGAAPPNSHAGYFALFVDRAPVRPGQTLLAIADSNCKHTPGCFNAQYLATRGVYTTASTSFTLQEIDNINSYQKVQLHEVTVILLDTSGRRIGESAWYIDFRMQRPTF